MLAHAGMSMKRVMAGSEDKDAMDAPPGSQTLLRGLDILDAVAAGAVELGALSATVGTTRSTTHRLASALVSRRYLNFAAGQGYSLGPKLLQLGFRAQAAMTLPQVARPHLERLSELCEDTIHLGILDNDGALYLDKISGRRRVEISSRIGERHPIWSTGVGKALILDMDEARWRSLFRARTRRSVPEEPSEEAWIAQMHVYAARGVAFDLEENEPQVRCVSAPLRSASGGIVAAISVSSTSPYMDDGRMNDLSDLVQSTARRISDELGHKV